MNFFSYIWHKLFPVNVTAIVSDLQKTVNRLENAVEHHSKQSDEKIAKANALISQASSHTAEANTATTVAANISSLINPGTPTT